ncbi:MAG: glycosyltransferase [Crocinitomicaceae bacterium]|nr:glycosyltransferase [Crocinitomicaceae bacterium]
MKILHIVEPLATGINTFILQLAQNLSSDEHIILHGIRKEGQDIEEVKNEYPAQTQFIHWTNAQREISLKKDFKAYSELKKRIKEIQPDVIHLHSSKAGIIGRFAARSCGIKKVIYTPNAASFLRTDVSPLKRKIFEQIERFSSRLPGEIISSSTCEQTRYAEIGIETKLIYNGAKVSKLNQPKFDKFTVVNCGVVSTQKNPKLFNEIALHFQDQSDIQFMWIGNGDEHNILNAPNLIKTGWKSKKEVFNILNSAHLYLSTSLWEGLPLAGIEAMGCGLPMLLNDCPGNNNLVLDNQNGYLFQDKVAAQDFLAQLKSKKDLMNSMGEGSLRIYNEYFTDEICTDAYSKLYAEL